MTALSDDGAVGEPTGDSADEDRTGRHLQIVRVNRAADDPGASLAMATPSADGTEDQGGPRRGERLVLLAVVLIAAVAAALFLHERSRDDPTPDRPASQSPASTEVPTEGDAVDVPSSAPEVPSTQRQSSSSTTPTSQTDVAPAPEAADPNAEPPPASEGPSGQTPSPSLPSPTSVPPAPPPSVSHLRVTATGGLLSWSYSFDDRNGGPATCELLANDTVVWTGPCTQPTVSGTFTGEYDTAYDISGRAANEHGSDTTRPATLRTPAPTLTITRGAPLYIMPDCWHPSCRYIDVMLAGFSPNADVTISCVDGAARQGVFKTVTLRTSVTGTATSSPCFFGYPGREVWVEAQGFESNVITW